MLARSDMPPICKAAASLLRSPGLQTLRSAAVYGSDGRPACMQARVTARTILQQAQEHGAVQASHLDDVLRLEGSVPWCKLSAEVTTCKRKLLAPAALCLPPPPV
jgi:hypothetical protein